MNYTIKNEFYTATVSNIGAELISLKSAEEVEFIWQNTGDFWNSHAPILFPACGRILNSKYSYNGVEYPLTTHGFIKDVEFSPVLHEKNHLKLVFSSNETTLKTYPFDFTFEADFLLTGDTLNFTVKITNNSSDTMPYMFGWHPGFILPTDKGQDIEDYKIALGEDIRSLRWFTLQNGPFVCPTPKEYKLERGEYKLCEEEIYANDTMIFEGHKNKATLYADGYPYELYMTWSDNIPELCIWKEDSNLAKFICIEPWDSLPNDGLQEENFNTRKMSRLASGKDVNYSYTVRIKH